MYLPELPGLKNSSKQTRVFGGLNETFGCTEAEYAAGENFSSRDFPALSTRMPRRKLQELVTDDEARKTLLEVLEISDKEEK